MASSNSFFSPSLNNPNLLQPISKTHAGVQDQGDDEVEKLYKSTIQKLEKNKGWVTDQVFNYQGTWLSPRTLKSALLLSHQHLKFKALVPDDILFLATFPKSGTTWFKALIYSVTNRKILTLNSNSHHPLLDNNPHDCIPFLEILISEHDHQLPDQLNNIDNRFPSTRPLLATHIPYDILSKSLVLPHNRVVYVARDPKDVLVSFWHYSNNVKLRSAGVPLSSAAFSLQEAYELFCKGVVHSGPYWDHVLGYWKASLESPESVLFLTYEYMKKEPLVCIKRLADFIGQGFTEEEEKDGVLDEILKLCSFENLSKLEVNKSGVQQFSPVLAIPNKCFFREGESGGWNKWLTDDMVVGLDKITKDKFEGSGLFLSEI